MLHSALDRGKSLNRNKDRMDSPSSDRAKSAGIAARDEISDILEVISRASTRSINGLKTALKRQILHRAVELLDQAGAIRICGLGDAFPVAALLAHGLAEKGRDCSIFGADGAARENEISRFGPDDLLIVIKLPGDKLPVAILDQARSRKVPILVVAEAAAFPLAGCCHVQVPAPNSRVFGAQTLAGHMTAVQVLLIALEQYRAAAK